MGPTLLDRLPTAFPSITPMPPDTHITLESSPESIMDMDASLASEPSATVASMADTTTEALLDTLVPTMAKFTFLVIAILIKKITVLLRIFTFQLSPKYK